MNERVKEGLATARVALILLYTTNVTLIGWTVRSVIAGTFNTALGVMVHVVVLVMSVAIGALVWYCVRQIREENNE